MPSRTVFKYSLDAADDQTIDMPVGAVILHAAEQDGVPCVWALVDMQNISEPRRFFTHGTGHRLHSDAKTYVGTVHMYDGAIVLHVFTP